ncbi:MAG: phosphoribosyltransferase family protein [Patescibacteria group bacterium]|nr:phosphoribosyltransferase family protein [Patescibacteria group bacterium]
MYFASRVQAGRMLATQLLPKYRYENCAVIGIGDGGVMIGAQIASQLHCVLTMLMIEEINLPREPIAIGGMLEDGTFSYNNSMSAGELDEMTSEYHGVIEQEKLSVFHKMNGLLGSGGLINRDLLRGHNIILASDGFKDSFTLDMALQFLKPIKIEKLIVATPLASVKAIDRMHITVDEINCLSVVEDYMDTDHYYEANDKPDHQTIIETIEKIVLQWQ